MRHYLNIKNLLALYYVFFHSHILHGILGWGSATITALKPIQILQNKALRIMNKTRCGKIALIRILYIKNLNLKM